ncbi:ZKSC8 protein, partial [Scytalopus superciliaris]|nr:ZKSC8 protein [Scytalopus superciliaris]
FCNSSNLITPQYLHTGEKPCKCPNCGKRFWSSSHLIKHQQTHMKEKPCYRPDLQPQLLPHHWCIHTGERPCRCPE